MSGRDDFFTEEELESLRKVTLDELEELAKRLGPLVRGLIRGEDKAKALSELRDIFHTIGGSAALAGFDSVSRLGSAAEALISKLPPGAPVPKDASAKIKSSLDRLEKFLRKHTQKPD